MGQSPQYNQRNKTKARYRDPSSFHASTDHGVVINSIQNGRGLGLQKREVPEPDKRARRCRLQSCGDARCVWCQRINQSSVHDLLTKLSICGNKRTKALKLLAEITENSSRWIWSRRKERFIHND